MRRKALWLSFGLLLLIAGCILAGVVALVRHVPDFYKHGMVVAGGQRKELSTKFVVDLGNLCDSIKAGGHPQTGKWRGYFSDVEINSFLQEDFLTADAQKLLPDGISNPRIAFEQDRIRLAFRYGRFLLSTIISIDFRVWVAREEPNVVVVELQGLHAGALPVSAQSLLEDISESLRRQNIQVTWYRHQGNPTAALKFGADQTRTAQLHQLELKAGTLSIVGQSKDPAR
jgi:hypothetical protein